MQVMRMTAATALFALTLAPAAALAGPYSAVYAFGDSLSDAGNAYIASGGTDPQTPPYALVNGYGVFSNGPVWVQDLAAEVGLGPLLPSLAGGTDFAVGGAETGAIGSFYAGTSGDLLSSVGNSLSQLAAFQAAVPDPSPDALYTLSVGSNDIMNVVQNDPANVEADLGYVLANITTFLQALIAGGARNIVLLNVPDLGKTPEAEALGPTVSAKLSAAALNFDRGLASSLSLLEAKTGVQIADVDTYQLLDEAASDPSAFGLTHTTSCITQAGVCSDPNDYLFLDPLHPTETGQNVVADAARSAIPEPRGAGLFAGALTMLGIARATRRTPRPRRRPA